MVKYKRMTVGLGKIRILFVKFIRNKSSKFKSNTFIEDVMTKLLRSLFYSLDSVFDNKLHAQIKKI